MVNLIICVLFFYTAHLFLKMTFSLHKIPFVNFTLANGDLSKMTDLSERMGVAGENLRQSLFIFIPSVYVIVITWQGPIFIGDICI